MEGRRSLFKPRFKPTTSNLTKGLQHHLRKVQCGNALIQSKQSPAIHSKQAVTGNALVWIKLFKAKSLVMHRVKANSHWQCTKSRQTVTSKACTQSKGCPSNALSQSKQSPVMHWVKSKQSPAMHWVKANCHQQCTESKQTVTSNAMS